MGELLARRKRQLRRTDKDKDKDKDKDAHLNLALRSAKYRAGEKTER
jgi:hypothetical protein